jgi:pimeloyl-ACP methyl ester carboxylesterase
LKVALQSSVDVKIHYANRGKGDEALVFVHGWACNADFWRPQMNDFGSLHLIAVDMVGHGQSDKPHVPYTMEYFARSIDAVLTDAKVKRAVLVGHSMGTPSSDSSTVSFRKRPPAGDR